MNCQVCQAANASGAVFCTSCGSKLDTPPASVMGTNKIGRAPAISLVLGGIGLIMYGATRVSFTSAVQSNTVYRLVSGLGTLGALFLFVALLSSIRTSARKFGTFPVVTALIGIMAIAGANALNPILYGYFTTAENNFYQYTLLVGYGLIGLAALVAAGIRNSSQA